jgi:hypothetical protein
MYGIGATILTIGVIFFVGQVWDDIGAFGRTLVTLIFGLIMAGIGSILLQEKPDQKVGLVFHIVGGLLIPGGIFVALNELNVDMGTLWIPSLVFAALAVFYQLLNLHHKEELFTFFSIIHATIFSYLLIGAIAQDSAVLLGDVYAYLTMILGLSYILLSHSFKDTWSGVLVGFLHLVGTFGFLAASFSRVFDSLPWQILYFVVVIGGMYVATKLKSRSMLVLSTGFLIAHISYITGEYFADSIGWPLALILLGFVFIGVGYASLNIGKKYLTNS